MSQRTWFITGVSSGFGHELSKQLLERGERVIGTVRGIGKVGDLVERFPDTFDVETLDVTDTPALREIVARYFERHGRIDVVINNAGYGLFA
jgi:NADP-dependent 3-hydroxy acid dehydrogenase YdfG